MLAMQRNRGDGLGGEVPMNYSRPFKRKGALHRWRFYDGVQGEQKKALQYFHRKARKWFDAKDPKGVRIVSKRRGRQ
jgi:hypothetical protein